MKNSFIIFQLIVFINILLFYKSGLTQQNELSENLHSQKNVNQHSGSHIIYLTDSWDIHSHDDETIKNSSIPYFIKDKSTEEITFKKYFTIPDSVNYSAIRLCVLGLNGKAVFKLNNHLISEHADISTTFKIEINKEFVLKEKNLLEITLTAPTQNHDFELFRFPILYKQYRPLGIGRELFLELLPDVFFDDVYVKYDNNKIFLNYKSIIKGKLNKPNKTIRVKEEIFSPNGNLIHKRFEYIEYKPSEKLFNREIRVKTPKLWSPNTPENYQLNLSFNTLTSIPYETELNFGLRKIKYKENQVYLNSTPIEIKGINYRFDYINSQNTFDSIKTNLLSDFIKIKRLGFNSIRFVNYIPQPIAAKYADSLGLLLFIDNGFWRLPENYYSNDKVLDIAKTSLKEILQVFGNSASLAAIGFGHEIPIDKSNTRKFVIILEKYLKDRFNILSYISPLSFGINPKDRITDFNMIFNYNNPNNIFSKIDQIEAKRFINLIPGNVGSPAIAINREIGRDKKQYNDLYNFYEKYASSKIFNGFFVESFKDWESELPSIITTNLDNNRYIYPFGLYNHHGQARYIYQFFTNYLKNEKTEISYDSPTNQTKIFSLVVFICAIIFLLICKKNYRFLENLKRSLKHPYGFFVDLRDRRIVSLFNSTAIGFTVAIIVSSFISAILYAYNHSLLVDEFITLFFNNAYLKSLYLSIIYSPWQLLSIFFILILVIQYLLSILLKIAGLFSKEKIKLRQTFAIFNWSGAPFIFFIPISLFTYYLTISDIIFPEIIWVFLVFCIWCNYRLANGIRVLFLMNAFRVALLFILTYLLLLVSFYFVIKSNYLSMEYLEILLKARNLYY